MSTPEPKRDPKGPPRFVGYSKPIAAKTQLETAITLWFNYRDPMAIHTLAAAAHALYHGIGSKAGTPTIIQTWKKSLSKKDLDRVNKAQNFGKHANTDPNGRLSLLTEHAELLILDSIDCHSKLFQKRTPLMSCFLVRFAVENPHFIDTAVRPERREHFREARAVYERSYISRMDYLSEVLPKLITARNS